MTSCHQQRSLLVLLAALEEATTTTNKTLIKISYVPTMLHMLTLFCFVLLSSYCDAFAGRGVSLMARRETVHPSTSTSSQTHDGTTLLYLADDRQTFDDALKGVVELPEINKNVNTAEVTAPTKSSTPAPFLSQGDIDPETLKPDLSDPKQARVIIYILISLIPVLFLIPLMLGSRELIPLEALPPVQL
jgi:hypothetical protein